MRDYRNLLLVERQQARRSLLIVEVPPRNVLIGMELVSSGFDFARDQALISGHTFAQQLYHLSEYVASRQPDDPNALDYEQQLGDSLKLDKTTELKTLMALREIGAALRAELSQEVVELLKFNGFLGDDKQEEPALTFQESERTPILWDIMYEGRLAGIPDWRKFWGFRTPISHWEHIARTEEILLRHGVFSATYEDMEFAENEIKSLAQHLPLSLQHRTLKDEFRKLVKLALQEHMQCNANEVESWLRSSEPKTWLRRFLNQLAGDGDEEYRELVANQWKRDHLIKVFKDAVDCDLFHFACPYESSEEIGSSPRLTMKIGGETVYLDIALLMTIDLRRELRSVKDPGPLVFLNICGAGLSRSAYELLSFPKYWIRSQGAIAVITPICPVPDYFAYAFACKFYEILFAALAHPQDPDVARNRYVAEALLATRRFFMQEYNNPLGLAYVLYAVKDAHITVEAE